MQGLSALEKQTAFNDWMTEKKTIIIATNAFGMGIEQTKCRFSNSL